MTDSFFFTNKCVLVAGDILTEDDDLTFDFPELVGAAHISSVLREAGAERGHASAALKKATDWADKLGLVMSLVAVASGDLSQSALEAWYGRNGFKKIAYGLMYRQPV